MGVKADCAPVGQIEGALWRWLRPRIAHPGIPGGIQRRDFAGSERPDLVISGINHGANMGDDTIYSGTVAAKNTGSRHFLIPSGPQANNYLILNGGVMTTADYFDTTTNTFATAGSITGCATGVSAGSWVFRVSSGGQSGKFMIICGGVNNTALFDPAGPSFAAGPTLGATASLGAHGFYITTGANAGKYLFILASANATRLYDPSLNAWGAGPTLCGTASGGGFNLPISAGIHTGKQLVVLGGGTTSTCFYDPATHTFSAGPGTGAHQGYAVGTDSLAFTLGYGVFPSAYVIIHGAQSTTFSQWFAY